MSSRVAKIIFEVVVVVTLGFLLNSCGSQPYCPTCGTTVNGAYGVLDVIPVPEHNPTGEPGGPFNSFDISWFDPTLQRVYVSDRLGLDIVVVDAKNNFAVNTIGGQNEVANGGNNNSVCIGPANPAPGFTAANTPTIPSIITGQGAIRAATPGNNTNVLTRFGCRNAGYFNSFSTYFPGFGAHGGFGGFAGAQCCAARANGVNPLSGPDGNQVTPDGKTLFVGAGSSSLVVFDLTTNPAVVLAAIPTGSSPDFDGPANQSGLSYGGIANCIQTWNGGAGSDPTCGDDRADELSYGTVNGHDIVLITNGDPGLPFLTLIDVTDIVNRTYTGTLVTPAGLGICAPTNPALNYNPGDPANPTAQGAPGGNNYPTCILGQIYYDGVVSEDSTVAVDGISGTNPQASLTPCPDQSESVASGVTGYGVGPEGADVPCHHAPIVDYNTGAFITNNGIASGNQAGELAPAGLGASTFNPFHNTFYVTNSNCTVSNLATQSSVAVGCVDEVDPRIGNPAGPIVIAVVPILNCMPTSIVQGPAHDFLVGCAGHDGIQFPPLEVIIDGTTNKILASVDQTGGVDEIWYNPGDNRYYTAGRDMPNGPVLGVIDAATRQWLVNVTTGSNSHSVTVNQDTNQIFVPTQAGALCGTQSANGCIAVYGRQ
ncbi:MAG TPA: hypothetical protein VKA02_10395 [Candidatus Acidoferrum sp.]|nr:hypothetical protein [Candidatus Acidoferrum sp.]